MLYFTTEGSNIRIKQGENDFKVLSNTSKCIDWTVYTDKIDLSIDETTFDSKNPSDIYFDGVASANATAVVASLKSMFPNLAGGGGSVSIPATEYADNTTALAALGAGELYKSTTHVNGSPIILITI